jgi:hypothetical protein
LKELDVNYNDYSIESDYHETRMKELIRASANTRLLDRSVDDTSKISERTLSRLVHRLICMAKLQKSKLASSSKQSFSARAESHSQDSAASP